VRALRGLPEGEGVPVDLLDAAEFERAWRRLVAKVVTLGEESGLAKLVVFGFSDPKIEGREDSLTYEEERDRLQGPIDYSTGKPFGIARRHFFSVRAIAAATASFFANASQAPSIASCQSLLHGRKSRITRLARTRCLSSSDDA
jgi:hypothetical protein